MSSPITTLLAHENKLRFLYSYFLWKTGLCRFVRFRAHGVKYHYFPSALSRMIYANRDYVKQEYQLLSEILEPGDTFIDVGANIGTWSLMASDIVGEKGKVMAFEPHPRVFGYLQANIALNHCANITPYNLGLSSSPGDLYLTDGMDDTNHLTTDGSKGIRIALETLDHFTAEIPMIKLLKIDVEGFELFVVKGALQTIRKCRQIVFESEPAFQRAAGYEGSELFSLLRSHGFRIYRTESGEEIPDNYSSPYVENLLAINSLIP